MRIQRLSRAIPSLASYVLTAAILVFAIIALEQELDAGQLKSFLSYVFVASLAAGLEPGTAKATLVGSDVKDNSEVSTALIAASVTKAVLFSPILLAIWLISDQTISIVNFGILVPIISILGFLATDVRVLLDAKGRYASAILLKQGSLSLAIACTAITAFFDYSLTAGIFFSCLARALWTFGFIWGAQAGRWPQQRLLDHLSPIRWAHFFAASALGSLSASIDRIIAFHFLDASAANTYFFVYELLSKFWLLPYLLVPIAFVKVVQSGAFTAFLRTCHLTIAAASIPFLLVAISLPYMPLGIVESFNFEVWQLGVFACAIVISAFNQVLSAELQASGFAALATASAITGLVVSGLGFPILVWKFGMTGLFFAWLLKSLTETLALWVAKLRSR